MTLASGHIDVLYISATLSAVGSSLLPAPIQLITGTFTSLAFIMMLILAVTVSTASTTYEYSSKLNSSAFSGKKKHLRTSTSALGLISRILSLITSTLSLPTVLLNAIICLLMLVRQTLSSSTRTNEPTPLLASASATYPPTPPIPNIATLLCCNLSIPSSPRSILVLEN